MNIEPFILGRKFSRAIELSNLSNVKNEIDKKCVAIKNNKNITILNLRYCLGRRMVNKITNFLKNNMTVTYLELGNNNLGDVEATKIASMLVHNKTIEILILSDNKIGSKGAENLALALEKNTTLTCLRLGHNNLQDQGAVKIAEALKINKSIKTLDISFDKIEEEGAICLADAILVNNTITILNVAQNFFGSVGIKKLVVALNKNKTIKVLQMCQTGRSGHTDIILAEMKENSVLTHWCIGAPGNLDTDFGKIRTTLFKSNKTICFLDLSGTYRLGPAIKYLASGLKVNKSIKTLILSFCRLDDTSVDTLMTALKENTVLQKLDLQANSFGEVGATKIGSFLSNNKVLAKINLSSNEIQNVGVEKIALALTTDVNITKLDLSENNLGFEGAMTIAKALKRNKSVKFLNLNRNNIVTEGAETPGIDFTTHTSLVNLSITGNKIGNGVARLLGSGLKYNKTLVTLKLDSNEIDNVSIGHLARCLDHNKVISKLSIESNNFIFGEFAKFFNFKRNKSLTKLTIGKISQLECEDVALALRENTGITYLDLQNVLDAQPPVDIEGFSSLISLLKVNNTITTLHYTQPNKIKDPKIEMAHDELQSLVLRNRNELVRIYSKELFSLSDALRLIHCDRECLAYYVDKEKMVNVLEKVNIQAKVQVLSTVLQRLIPSKSFSTTFLLEIIRYFSIYDFAIYFKIAPLVFQNITIDIYKEITKQKS